MVRANLDLTFQALADPTRRGVVGLLRRQPLRASTLAEELGASKPAMSRHLRVLRSSGLVVTTDPDADPDGDRRERVYMLVPDPFTQLREWLEEVEQFWMVQLDAFKAHVEAEPYVVPRAKGTHIADRTRRKR